MGLKTHALNRIIYRLLDSIERLGNRLPDPAFLFAGLGVLILLASWACHHWGIEVLHPLEQKMLRVENLLAPPLVQRIFTEMVKNFATFPPLATVLVTLMGVAVAEKTGLIATALKGIVLGVPRSWLTSALVFVGVMSSMAADAGYVVLTPLGAVLFASMGRHPLAGLAAVFAGVSGGYSANLFLTSLDPLLAGITQKAAQLVDPSVQVNASANYYFMVVSTFLLTVLGTWVTVKIIEPRLGPWKGSDRVGNSHTTDNVTEDMVQSRAENEIRALSDLTPLEKKGLGVTAVVVLVYVALILSWVLPEQALLRDESGGLKPFFDSLVALMALGFLVAGVTYGWVTRQLRSTHDLSSMMSEYLATLAPYLVLSFFAAQMLAYFTWSNLGIVLAVKGAQALQALNLGALPLFLVFMLLVSLLNLIMGSASAKWAMMAPIFVPMLMLLGYSPDVTQAAYRVGDSVTNMISPLLPYFPIILAVARRYDPSVRLGTLLALMIPYSLVFAAGWGVLFLIWLLVGLPFGT